jgi:hypothetical protein
VGGGGVELAYTWLEGYTIAVRAGARTAPPATDVRHLTAGAGLTLDRLTFDYALESLTGSGHAHRLGVRLR